MTEIHMVTREEAMLEIADPGRRDREALRELQKRHDDLFQKYAACNFAIGLLTGHFPPFNEQTKKLAEDCLAKQRAEWNSRPRHNAGKGTQL
jgi:hypothetical protein